MAKQVLADNYLKAFYVLYGKKFVINTVEQDHEEGTIILKSKMINPESLLIKKQQFEGLSNEAKEVIELVLNAPTEILEMIQTKKQKRITKITLRKYLIEHWKSPFIADLTINELEQWTKKF